MKKRKIPQEKDSAEPMKKLKAKGKTPYTQKFVWGWKQDNKGNPIRNWLRYSPESNKMFCDLCIENEAHVKKPLKTHDLGKLDNVWCVW